MESNRTPDVQNWIMTGLNGFDKIWWPWITFTIYYYCGIIFYNFLNIIDGIVWQIDFNQNNLFN